jgi:hypothetical protein
MERLQRLIMQNKIINSIKKFNLSLENKNILTEAASGNYVVTSIIAALAGANVTAIAKHSKYASIEKVKNQTYKLAKKFNIEHKINIIESIDSVNLSNFDIVTNTGFVRPIDKKMIDKLSSKCVIPLMWEPWEFRSDDLNLNYCIKKDIKVYGTNESDDRLKTMSYIGYIVLHFLLDEKRTPFSSNILLLGNENFTTPIINILENNKYKYKYITDYNQDIELSNYNVIVIAEHSDNVLLVGDNGFIKSAQLSADKLIIHICGNVDFSNIKCNFIPENPSKFGYMSFTTDYIDSQAVIDLHTAGLKVAEGMLYCNMQNYKKEEYKNHMEQNYNALAFNDERYW